MVTPYYEQLADWTNFIPESEIRLNLGVKVKFYFAGGKPGNLPIPTFKKILLQVAEELETDGFDILNYGPRGGFSPLQTTLAERMKKKDGIPLPKGKDDVIITTG